MAAGEHPNPLVKQLPEGDPHICEMFQDGETQATHTVSARYAIRPPYTGWDGGKGFPIATPVYACAKHLPQALKLLGYVGKIEAEVKNALHDPAKIDRCYECKRNGVPSIQFADGTGWLCVDCVTKANAAAKLCEHDFGVAGGYVCVKCRMHVDFTKTLPRRLNDEIAERILTESNEQVYQDLLDDDPIDIWRFHAKEIGKIPGTSFGKEFVKLGIRYKLVGWDGVMALCRIIAVLPVKSWTRGSEKIQVVPEDIRKMVRESLAVLRRTETPPVTYHLVPGDLIITSAGPESPVQVVEKYEAKMFDGVEWTRIKTAAVKIPGLEPGDKVLVEVSRDLFRVSRSSEHARSARGL